MLKPHPDFQRSARQVVVQILFFILTYLVLVLAGAALAAACVLGGLALMMAIPNFFILLVGVGIIGLGLMVLFFLLKFLFHVNRQDRSGYIRIMEGEQPELFQTIRSLSTEIGAPFPKHVYLAPDVNASVFYDSGFWSMFFPVRKNLVIGLGLINSLNKGELKAVLAHEFGHFSQSSMKLGSYVYQVNKVIYNMLYDNEGFGKALNAWASVSSTFAVFAQITVSIVKGIQSIQKKMYAQVNKSYMGLSREMEFHADAVAAEVAGANNLITALTKLELGDASYQWVLNRCDGWLKDQQIARNFYTAQQYLLNRQTATGNWTTSFNRINCKDQWASHPPMEERIKALKALNRDMSADTGVAWDFLQQPESVQESMTSLVYKNGEVDTTNTSFIDLSEFSRRYDFEQEHYSLPAAYAGCYDGRPFSELTMEVILAAPPEKKNWEELCAADQATVYRRIIAAEQDIQLLQAILDKQVEITSFDFEGAKYQEADAAQIKAKIEVDREEWKAALVDFDLQMARIALQKAKEIQREEELVNSYTTFLSVRDQFSNFEKDASYMFQLLEPIFKGESITIELITSMMVEHTTNREPAFKQYLKAFMEDGLYTGKPELSQKVQNYLNANFVYFANNQFFESEFNTLIELYRSTADLKQESVFEQFKKLLVLQLDLLSSPTPASAGLSGPLSTETAQPVAGTVPLN